jgi:glucose-1-phosphate adenylyltransferase
MDSFFHANLELASFKPPFTFYDEKYPIYTRARSLPGSRLDNCTIEHTLMADGCFIEKSTIKNAVIGIRTIISKNTEIENSVIMGDDFYEPGTAENLPHLGIGKNCVIHNAIIDKNARIGNNVKIINSKKKIDFDGDRYYIRDGIVVIPKNTIIEDFTVI